ncbi:hypothetical protein [Lactiplantibacillus pentosus]|uniref:hypothetical protein n=1 Tax=Lactiplantibacillus pentosus TaxID=1589 RepID=UPI00207A7D10|nr:hypothetical protein [Lactiplantibacillus pentosus]USJ86675.1 hypothetical protein KSF55_02085 [Lactiplantibacillus pentosus]
MDRIISQLHQISQGTGIPIAVGEAVESSTVAMGPSDQKNTLLVQGTILDQAVLFLVYNGQHALRPVVLFPQIKQSTNTPIVLLATQLSTVERREYLRHLLPFMTSDGEMFLPFMGTRLLPGLVTEQQMLPPDKLAPAEQRLALTLVMAQLIFEHSPDHAQTRPELAAFSTANDRFLIKSGQRFADTMGKQVNINNRVTFNRAAKQLVARGWLKALGETKDRVYACQFNSRRLFEQIAPFLTSPVQNANRVQFAEFPTSTIAADFLYSGVSALSKVTMISDNQALPTIKRQKVLSAGQSQLGAASGCEVQVSKYQLGGFNQLLPFMTSDGEMFLPFMGTRLLPGLVTEQQMLPPDKLAPAEQRLALTLVMAQLIF